MVFWVPHVRASDSGLPSARLAPAKPGKSKLAGPRTQTGSPKAPKARPPQLFPKGSKYPIFEVSGPQKPVRAWFWNQSPQLLGIWTPSVCNLEVRKQSRSLSQRLQTAQTRGIRDSVFFLAGGSNKCGLVRAIVYCRCSVLAGVYQSF